MFSLPTLIYMIILYHSAKFKDKVPEDERSVYICVTFCGRLGNQLFQYASLYGVAKSNGFKIAVTRNMILSKYFKVSAINTFIDSATCNSYKTIMEENFAEFDVSLMSLQPTRNYRISQYLQSWKYFSNYFPDIRKELELKTVFEQKARETIDVLRNNNKTRTVIGVHIRRGDLNKKLNIKLGYQLAPVSFIHRAIDYVLSRFNNTVFIVCSDDKKYSRQIENYRNISTVYFNGSEIEDFALLSHADHVITTVGTYGLWTGFLSGGTILYYKYPFRKGSLLAQRIRYEDFFPDWWVGLD